MVGDSTMSTMCGPLAVDVTAVARLLAVALAPGMACDRAEPRNPRQVKPRKLLCRHAGFSKYSSLCLLRACCHLNPRSLELECNDDRELAQRECTGREEARVHMSLASISAGRVYVQEAR